MRKDAPSPFERADRVVEAAIRWISYASGVFLAAIMLIAFFDVVGQKLARLGIPGMGGIPMASGLIQYFHIPVVFLAAGFVTLDRGHTNIDLLSSRLPKAVQKVMTSIGHLLGASVCAFVAYRAFAVLTVRFYVNHSLISTAANSWPKWPFAFIHGLGFTVMCFSFLWAVARQYLGSDRPVPRPGEMQPGSAAEGEEK